MEGVRLAWVGAVALVVSQLAGDAPGRAIKAMPAVAAPLPDAADGFATKAATTARMTKLPLRFEANAGQWDPRVRFRARQGGATLFVTDEGMTVGLTDVKPVHRRPGETPDEERKERDAARKDAKRAAVSIKLVGAKPSAPRGEQEIVTKSNFFLGNDPSKWRTNVPNYAAVRARGWLPGVEVVWHGGPSGLEYDLEVAAGVDVRKIAFDVEGADSLRANDEGALEIATAAGTLVQRPPRVVQDGRELHARYRVSGARRIALGLEAYDPASAVLVDPVLTYATYLGGTDDQDSGIAVDSNGNTYMTGTTSGGFPTTPGAYQSTCGCGDAFVAKLNATGSALIYSTYLGGTSADYGGGIAVDTSGNAYVTGSTNGGFPTTPGAFQTVFGGKAGYGDAFVTKLNATGSALVYSTYLGGSAWDGGNRIAIDVNGNAYVTGYTLYGFPTTSGAYQTTSNGYDAFLTKLNAAGSALLYSTYLGNGGVDAVSGLAVDSSGNAYVAGQTNSFPTTPSAYQPTFGGGAYDAFVMKLNPAGSALVYSTYLGSTGDDGGSGLAIDSSGNAYVVGRTSGPFPTTNGAEQATFGGGSYDAFVTKLSPAGSALVYSTYLGGGGSDQGQGIAVDSSGSAYLSGYNTSGGFPTTPGAFQSTYGGGTGDAFVAKLNATGSALSYASYLGGSGDEGSGGLAPCLVAIDSSGNAYVTGYTNGGFPTTPGAYQTTYAGAVGGHNVFVAKISDPQLASGTACTQAGVCASGRCVDGVCCDQACGGQCQACDVPNHVGTCWPVAGAPHGSRPACAGTGACAGACNGVNTSVCAYPGASTLCGATSCTGGTETDDVCDSAGACTGQVTHTCDNYGCSSNGLTCNTTCSTDGDCGAGFFCQGTACVSEDAQGTACTRDRECLSGHCVDGACCDTACAGQCEACDVGGAIGTCSPVNGAPHGSRSACGPSAVCGVCDGNNRSTCTYPESTTSCASPTCSGGVETDSTCDGQGACVVASHSCSNLTCTADGTQCKSTCAADSDCLQGFVCVSGACIPTPSSVCVDGHTRKDSNGTVTECAPYKCVAGTCVSPCTSVDDCIAPNVCDPTGKCVPPPSADSGCSCGTASGRSPPWGTALLAAAAALAIARSRRRERRTS